MPNRKLLLITYYFPPCGGAGVQRWVRLLPVLIDKGLDITVLTTQDGDYPVRDISLLQRIPRQVKVIRTHTPVFGRWWSKLNGGKEPLPYGSLDSTKAKTGLKKLLYWIRINLIIPDARVIWNRHAFNKALELCRANRYDWVITTAPPHSTHLIGWKLKRHINIHWMADFRDPWTKIYYLQQNPPNRFTAILHHYLEKMVVKTADMNVVISHHLAAQLPQGRKEVLYNSYDEGQFRSLSYQRGQSFRIKYIGQLTAGQDMPAFLICLNKLCLSRGIDDITFTFVGTSNPTEIHQGMLFTMERTGYLPHQEALAEMVNAELLILLINDYADNSGMLTTKLFEYVASRTPILSIGQAKGEATQIIQAAQAGLSTDSCDTVAEQFIYSVYQSWKEGRAIRNDADISAWSVTAQADNLIRILYPQQ